MGVMRCPQRRALWETRRQAHHQGHMTQFKPTGAGFYFPSLYYVTTEAPPSLEEIN